MLEKSRCREAWDVLRGDTRQTVCQAEVYGGAPDVQYVRCPQRVNLPHLAAAVRLLASVCVIKDETEDVNG